MKPERENPVPLAGGNRASAFGSIAKVLSIGSYDNLRQEQDLAISAASTQSASEIAELSIQRLEPGRFRRPCPKCRKGPTDTALVITIDVDRTVVWWCHRCHSKGSWRSLSPILKGHGTSSWSPRLSVKRSSLSDKGHEIWEKALALTPDGPVGQYLLKRGCPLRGQHLRWLPSHYHRRARREFPCLIALITDIQTSEPVSLHFTYVTYDGSGKAPVDPQRLYLTGHTSRGVVRLSRDDAVEQGIIIGEGLETCLTAMLEFGSVWSCLDAGGIKTFPLLPGLEGLTVLIDNDDAGRNAFVTVRGRYQSAGIEVVGVEITGKPGADLNDVVNGAV